MKVFKAEDWWKATIEEVEIDGMTENFVRFKAESNRFNQKREAIQSSHHRYCRNHDAAKHWLLGRAEKNLESSKEKTKQLEEKIEKIKEL